MSAIQIILACASLGVILGAIRWSLYTRTFSHRVIDPECNRLVHFALPRSGRINVLSWVFLPGYNLQGRRTSYYGWFGNEPFGLRTYTVEGGRIAYFPSMALFGPVVAAGIVIGWVYIVILFVIGRCIARKERTA